MSGSPLVSVLMGAFNCAATVAESIESILAQDYTKFEFIICDDGSTDETPGIIARYAKADPRIVALRNEGNRGLSATLNRCIEAAEGSYLARMDGDDRSRPERLGRQVAFLESHPEFDLVGSSVALFDGRGIWGRHDYPERPEVRDFLLKSPFVHPSVTFRAVSLRKAGGYASGPKVGRSEDYELFMRLHAAGSRGYNLPELLFEYREEHQGYRKRLFRYALAETRVRYRGFARLGLLPGGLPWVIKPILVGLIPRGAYTMIRKALFGSPRRDSPGTVGKTP